MRQFNVLFVRHEDGNSHWSIIAKDPDDRHWWVYIHEVGPSYDVAESVARGLNLVEEAKER